MAKRRRLSVNEYAEVETLDHMEVSAPIVFYCLSVFRFYSGDKL